MYNLILLYLSQLDNTYYKNSYKVEEYFWMDKEMFNRLVYINKGNEYNYRDIDTYGNIYNINGHHIYDDYMLPLKLSTKYWF